MKFSVYSEIQYWSGKSEQQAYEEIIEQIVNADRLGYDAYAVIEHFFLPRFSISPDPLMLFAACAPRTRRITFRTLVHVLPYHNPTVLASRIGLADILLDGRYEFGLARGHAWIGPKAGISLGEVRDRYQESFDVFFKALANERFSHEGAFYVVNDSHVVPRPKRPFRIFLGGTSDETYVLAGQKGWGMVVPPLLPYEVLRQQLDLYQQTCAEHGHRPDIVWIHACYLDEDRDRALQEAEQGVLGFLKGNASPAPELAPKEELEAAGYGFYAAGILEQLASTFYDELVAGDYVWVGTPSDVIERIEAIMEVCEGLTEISITVNPGGFEHWQAIKAQELFAHRVMPHFRAKAAAKADEPALA